jgi:hypothetical protein
VTGMKDLLTGHMRMGVTCLTSNLEVFGNDSTDRDQLTAGGRKVGVVMDRADLLRCSRHAVLLYHDGCQPCCWSRVQGTILLTVYKLVDSLFGWVDVALGSGVSSIPCILGPMDQNLVAGAAKPSTRELSALQIQAATAYGHGMSRRQIAKAMLDSLTPTTVGQPEQIRMRRATRKLRIWEKKQQFRDQVYSGAIANVDMALPMVLNGVVGRARRGRVDAARLALEITGRHNPKGEQSAPMVVVAIDGIKRPGPIQIEDGEVVEADAVER